MPRVSDTSMTAPSLQSAPVTFFARLCDSLETQAADRDVLRFRPQGPNMTAAGFWRYCAILFARPRPTRSDRTIEKRAHVGHSCSVSVCPSWLTLVPAGRRSPDWPDVRSQPIGTEGVTSVDDVGSVTHPDRRLNIRSQQPPKVGGLGISTSPRMLRCKMHRAVHHGARGTNWLRALFRCASDRREGS
jgi:hypothetical protein